MAKNLVPYVEFRKLLEEYYVARQGDNGKGARSEEDIVNDLERVAEDVVGLHLAEKVIAAYREGVLTGINLFKTTPPHRSYRKSENKFPLGGDEPSK